MGLQEGFVNGRKRVSMSASAPTVSISLPNEHATRGLGAALAGVTTPGAVILLRGPLGAGKTTLVDGFTVALRSDIPPERARDKRSGCGASRCHHSRCRHLVARAARRRENDAGRRLHGRTRRRPCNEPDVRHRTLVYGWAHARVAR